MILNTDQIKSGLIRLSWDEDGWILKVNDEVPYPHLLHVIPLANATSAEIKGSALIRFVFSTCFIQFG